MLTVNHVSYAYDNYQALHDVSLTVEEGEIVCLLGPSGCGKTTLLRVIAGLETGYHGDVIVAGQDMQSVPVHERDFGLMFQDFALFPHMTVEGNVAYGLKRKGITKNDIHKQVEQILARVGLPEMGGRDVNQLSGGQKQRVALARSLAPNPRLLMLDEPLGSLDALLRDQLIIELRDIIKSIGLTAVYVTHDQKEAYAIADQIAIMNQGYIEQVDTPQNIYYRPKTEFVARFLGLSNIFPTEANFLKALDLQDNDLGEANAILIHPAGIRLSGSDSDIQLSGTILQKVFRGELYEIVMQIADEKLLRWTTQQADVDVGEDVIVEINREFVVKLQEGK